MAVQLKFDNHAQAVPSHLQGYARVFLARFCNLHPWTLQVFRTWGPQIPNYLLAKQLKERKMPLKVVDATVSNFNQVFESFKSEVPKNQINLLLFLADQDPSTSLSWCPGTITSMISLPFILLLSQSFPTLICSKMTKPIWVFSISRIYHVSLHSIIDFSLLLLLFSLYLCVDYDYILMDRCWLMSSCLML